jgi:hypothetical protein
MLDAVTGRLGIVVVASVAAALALPAVWWEPLHLDERITIEYAERSFRSIVRDVFVDRGGAPLHFFVEHLTLSAPGGIEGLRLPSVACFLLALVLAGMLARRLADDATATLVMLLLAVAPLGLSLATFARMYSLFVAATLTATLLAVRAGRSGSRRDWLLAGATVGALVYVHPIAPLYGALAAATGILVSDRPLRRAVREAAPGAALAVVVALPYAYALAVLRSRYDVFEASRLRTTAGRSVTEEALHALTPGGTVGAAALAALALAGAIALARTSPRTATALALWVLVPVLFFSLVPAQTRFFGRYLAPAEPAFYLLVVTGCMALARRRELLAFALVAVVAVVSIEERLDVLQRSHDLGLRELVRSVGPDDIVFSSTGTRTERPAELLDDHVLLEGRGRRVEELPGIDLRFEPNLRERGAAALASFLAGGRGGRGAWIFRGSERRVTRAVRRVAGDPDLEAVRVSPTLLLIRSRRNAAPPALVEQGLRARTAWTLRSPADRWTTLLLAIGRDQRAGASP